jgi:hypothetical protein
MRKILMPWEKQFDYFVRRYYDEIYYYFVEMEWGKLGGKWKCYDCYCRGISDRSFENENATMKYMYEYLKENDYILLTEELSVLL